VRQVDEELRAPKCRTSRSGCHVPYTAGNEAPSASRHCFSSRLGQTLRLTLSHPYERWSAAEWVVRFSADFSLAHIQQQRVQSIDPLADVPLLRAVNQ
jgi:hypothetical protein